LRIPAHLPDKIRFSSAKEWIDDYNPELLSLQFVPFSFQSKGLPIKMGKQLHTSGGGRRWHIMFHELWVGMESGSSNKMIWWGWLQKQIIRSLIRKLKPDVIHTQVLLYQTQLRELGFKSSYLPLFGNIPVANSNCFRRKNENQMRRNKTLVLVLFGAIHKGVPVASLAEEAARYSRRHGIKLTLVLIGRNGPEQKQWTAVWRDKGIDVKALGEQPSHRISEVFERASVGISTTPVTLIEKSGSVAAMREHGLPVICVRQDWHAEGIDNSTPLSGIIEYRVGNFKDCLSNLKTVQANSSLENVGTTLLEAFQ